LARVTNKPKKVVTTQEQIGNKIWTESFLLILSSCKSCQNKLRSMPDQPNTQSQGSAFEEKGSLTYRINRRTGLTGTNPAIQVGNRLLLFAVVCHAFPEPQAAANRSRTTNQKKSFSTPSHQAQCLGKPFSDATHQLQDIRTA
jgi:hypothetical protein